MLIILNIGAVYYVFEFILFYLVTLILYPNINYDEGLF